MKGILAAVLVISLSSAVGQEIKTGHATPRDANSEAHSTVVASGERAVKGPVWLGRRGVVSAWLPVADDNLALAAREARHKHELAPKAKGASCIVYSKGECSTWRIVR